MIRKARWAGPLRKNQDEVGDIVLAVMEHLHRDEFRRLLSFVALKQRQPGLPFMAWVAVLARRVGLDHLRAHRHYLDNRHRRQNSAWIREVTLPSGSKLAAGKAGITDAGTVAEVMRFASIQLSPVQHKALQLWTAGFDALEISRELDLDTALDAQHLVRAAIERLRRQFRPEP